MGFIGEVAGGILGFDEPEVADMSGQTQAAADATALYERMYEEGVERGQPFLEAGTASVGKLSDLLGLSGDTGAEGYGSLTQTFGMDQFQADPSYDFRQSEGQKAIDRAMAAKGRYYSPEAEKALMDYNQNLASQEYASAYDRYNIDQSNLYNRLAGISGTGQTQAAQQTAAGQNMASNVSATNIGLQDALTSNQLATDTSRQSMFNTLLGAAGTGASIAAMSDIRTKENILYEGVENGHNIYSWNYIGSSGRWKGVMAQEVIQTHPESVISIDGILHVFYDKLGVKMRAA